MSSSAVSAKVSSTSTIGQDSEKSFVRKPPSLRLRMPSQESTTTAPLSASSGQRTPPIASLVANTLPVDVKKIGHRRVDEQTGQVTYKKKTTSDLMKAIQLGIGQSVGSLTSKPTRDVLMQDFSVVESMHFPENGSNLTPAHRVGDFRFKTYAPVAFRYFRELFGIQTDDFLISLTSLPLTELSNPGASGSVFFITEDDEFIIKTVQHKEADFLQKLLPGYYMNLNQNPRTLLPKFYGLYCLQSGGKNIRLCVMNNLLPSAIRKSEKYDLKGSTYKRKASKHELAKSSPTFKDLDFKDKNPDGILLEAETYEALMKTIKRDCRVLESFKIMDYSLLLCMFNVDDAKRLKQMDLHGASSSHPLTPIADEPSTSKAGAEAGLATPGAIQRGRSTKHRLAQFSTAMESIQADSDPIVLEDEDVPPGGIPARNGKGQRLLLYMGVIDILQSYRFKKKLEHGFKSLVYDGDTISVHRPSYYSSRFQTFFESQVFKKIVSLQQIKKGPAWQHVQSGHANSAIRSPSKKKSSTGRQRSFTEPTATETAVSADPEGALLHKNKPDLIPQVSAVKQEEKKETSRSSRTFDPQWSGSTMSSTTALTSSSVSTVLTTYVRAQSKDHSDPPQSVQEESFDQLPPPNDDPLPPYSELAPPLNVTDQSGGARSKQYSKPSDLSVGIQPNKTVSAPAVLANDDEPAIKSSIRREQSDKVDNKKGVRFSASHSDEEELTGDELLSSATTVCKGVATDSVDEYRLLKPLSADVPLIGQLSNTVSSDEVILQIAPVNAVETDSQPNGDLVVSSTSNDTTSNQEGSSNQSAGSVNGNATNHIDSDVSLHGENKKSMRDETQLIGEQMVKE